MPTPTSLPRAVPLGSDSANAHSATTCSLVWLHRWATLAVSACSCALSRVPVPPLKRAIPLRPRLPPAPRRSALLRRQASRSAALRRCPHRPPPHWSPHSSSRRMQLRRWTLSRPPPGMIHTDSAPAPVWCAAVRRSALDPRRWRCASLARVDSGRWPPGMVITRGSHSPLLLASQRSASRGSRAWRCMVIRCRVWVAPLHARRRPPPNLMLCVLLALGGWRDWLSRSPQTRRSSLPFFTCTPIWVARWTLYTSICSC
mmetsp:Transcript_17506/g.52374  ORF Transcript_17506/g.52374 Transcript_17506/m.52374 type:complete len:258 (-) Transcript_17506:1903-2676(-)